MFSTAMAGSRARPSSGILRPFPDQALPPARAQDVAPLRIFLVEIIGVDDAVGAEAAEILAQLAPGREQPHRLVDSRPRSARSCARWRGPARRDNAARSSCPRGYARASCTMSMRSGSRFQPGRAPLAGSSTNGRSRSGTVSAILAIRSSAARASAGSAWPDDPLRAQHRRLDLVGRQHQGRQVEALFEDVAHAGLAADRHALADQRRRCRDRSCASRSRARARSRPPSMAYGCAEAPG